MNTADPEKKVIVQICMTKEESDFVKKRAKESGLSMSNLARVSLGLKKNEKGLNFKTDNPRKKITKA